MLGDLLSGLFGGVLGGSLSDRLSQRRACRLREQRRVECALRIEDGHHPGLTHKWRHGVADLSAGVIDMGWASVEVWSLDAASVRRPSAREAWSVSPGCRLIRVESPTAALEWAIPDKQFEWATSQVSSGPS